MTMTFKLLTKAQRYRKALQNHSNFEIRPSIDSRATTANLNESNAVTLDVEVMGQGTLHIVESLMGSWRNETITINQRGSFRGHDRCHYFMEIDAAAGDDTIIINHLNRVFFGLPVEEPGLDQGDHRLAGVHLYGGRGQDTFVVKSRGWETVALTINDMEIGEKFVTRHSSGTCYRAEDEPRENIWYVDDGNHGAKHRLLLPDESRLEQLFNAEGDAIYMVLPES